MKKLNFLFSLFLLALFSFFYPVKGVNAQPNIFVNSDSLEFGDVLLGSQTSLFFPVFNLGNEELVVTDIVFNNEDLSADETNFTIGAGSYKDLEIILNPSSFGNFSGELTIQSNDPSEPNFNLPLTANVSVSSPEYLVGKADDNSVLLSWGAGGDDGNWLQYDNGNVSGLIGFGSYGQFRIASKWPSESLTSNTGEFLSRVAFYPSGKYSDYYLQILTGENGDSVVYEATVEQIRYYEWNEYHLSESVEIIAGNDYWIALVITEFSDFNASVGFDTSPATEGLSNLIFVNGQWQPASLYGYYSNWLIRGFLSEEGTKTFTEKSVSKSGIKAMNATNPRNLIIDSSFSLDFDQDLLKNSLDIALGYNFYRDGVLLNNTPVTSSTFSETGLDHGVYTYGATIVFDDFESDAAEREIHVGAPELSLNPVSIIYDEVTDETLISENVLLANTGFSTLDWSVDTLPSWISLSSNNGSIEPGESQELSMDINPEGLNAGIQVFNIKIHTNNANKPEYYLHVYLFIVGQQVLEITDTIFDFGKVAIGRTKSVQIDYTNISDEVVYLGGLYYEPFEGFSSYVSTSWLYPGNSGRIIMSYWPTETGPIEGMAELSYLSNIGSGKLTFDMFAEGYILKPSNLSVALDDDEQEVTLSWLTPGVVANEIFFGNGIPQKVIPTSGPGIIEAAIKFDSDDLLFYNNRILEEVSISIARADADITVNVYIDEGASEPLMSINVDEPQAFSWNTVTLPTPIGLDTLDYLWLAYEMNMSGSAQALTARADKGPAIAGAGDWIKIDGNWTTLSQSGISRNWGIKGLLSGEEDKNLGKAPEVSGKNNSPDNFLGYRIYRNGELITNELYLDNVFVDTLGQANELQYGVSAVFTYGESETSEATILLPVNMSLPEGWEFERSAIVHNLHLPQEIFQIGFELKEGDLMGVFYKDDAGNLKSAGVTIWEGVNTQLTAYGNDPETDYKNGFDPDEPLIWKFYNIQSGKTSEMMAIYDHSMPHHDGLFKMMGLSQLKGLFFDGSQDDDPLSLGEAPGALLRVYPNPSRGQFIIEGLDQNSLVRVYDLNGRLTYSQKVNNASKQFFLEERGNYMLEVIYPETGKIIRKKLVVY